ncbi:hypothetical protein AB0G71_22675 [Streptomyces sp. NPDC020403]
MRSIASRSPTCPGADPAEARSSASGPVIRSTHPFTDPPGDSEFVPLGP